MSCCGRARVAFTKTPVSATPGPQVQLRRHGDVEFEYTGRTGLTVRSPVTGAVYRFNRTGSRVLVRAKDSAALAALPLLRRVSR
jgi:hypothetical protein